MIAFSVSFMLIVFQPFGTKNFQHPYKTLILAGYGACIFSTISIYYYLSLRFFSSKIERWTILLEVLDLFLISTLSIMACYTYAAIILYGGFKINTFLAFFFNATSVALIPCVGAFIYLYIVWKDVLQSTLSTSTTQEESNAIILTFGNSKSDQIQAQANDVLLVKAQDNYVMLYLQNEAKLQRHIIRATLKQIYQQLNSDHFLQVHRSYIVNRLKMLALHGNKSKPLLELEGFDKKIPVSRSKYDDLKNRLN